MAIDARLPLAVQAPQVPSLFEQYGNVLKLRDLRAQMDERRALAEERQQKLRDTRALDAAYAAAIPKATPAPAAPAESHLSVDQVEGRAPVPTAPQATASGKAEFNKDAFMQALTARGAGHLVPDAMKVLGEYEETAAKIAKAKGDLATQESDYIGSLGRSIHAMGDDPQAAIALFGHAKTLGYDTVVPLIQAIAQDPRPETVKRLADAAIAKSKEATASAATASNAASSALNAETSAAREKREATGATPPTEYQREELKRRDRQLDIETKNAETAANREAREAGSEKADPTLKQDTEEYKLFLGEWREQQRAASRAAGLENAFGEPKQYEMPPSLNEWRYKTKGHGTPPAAPTAMITRRGTGKPVRVEAGGKQAPAITPQTAQYSIGQIVTLKNGQRRKITGYKDGQYTGIPVE